MQVSLEALEGLKRRLTITVPAERVESEYKTRINKVAQTARIDGFRPGKVPKHEVEKRYSNDVMREVAGELIRESLDAAIKEKDLKLAGYPQVDFGESMPLQGQPLEFKADLEVFPEIRPAAVEGLKVTKQIAEVTDADIDKTLDSLRKQHAEFKETQDASQEGDRITIDYEGKIDGEVFEGGSANDVPVVIGSKGMIPGFEEGLVGLKAGDEKVLELTFPEDYHSKDHAGKRADFAIKVKAVSHSELPEMNEDFLKKFNVDSLEKLREETQLNLTRNCEQLIKNKLKEAVIDQLLDINTVEIPDALVANEINHLKQQAVQQFGAQSKEQQDQLAQRLPDDMFKEQAAKNVRVGLLLSEMMKAREMKVDADKVRAYIENMAASYEKPEQAVSWYYSQKEIMSQIEHLVLEEQLIDAILEDITVKEEQVDYDKLMEQ